PEFNEFFGPKIMIVRTLEGLVLRIPESLVFEPNQWAIQEQALPVLEDISKFLLAHPKNRLVVQGHTDSTGSKSTNRKISKLRASAVYQYLLSKGIGPERMAYEGLGAE